MSDVPPTDTDANMRSNHPGISTSRNSAGGDDEIARGCPGWALRVAVGVAGALAIAVVMSGAPEVGVASMPGFAMMLLVLVAAFAPGTVAPLLLLIGLVIYRILAADPGMNLGLAALVALMPLIHQLAGAAAAIPARSRIRWPALRPAAIRYLIAVLPVQAVLLVSALV